MQLVCTVCGTEFEEWEGIRSYHECHTELDGSPVERVCYLVCPYCGADGDDLEEVREEDAEL